MRFGPLSAGDSAGAIAAHTLRAGETIVRKGRAIDAAAAADLVRAGIAEVVAARLDPGDVGEDAAAARLADRLAGAGLRVEAPFTGRCNLFAARAGVLCLDAASVEAVNAVDEAITLATLSAHRPVVAGEMVATVKIIPYAVAGAPLARALGAAAPLAVAPYRRARVGVVSTLLPGLKGASIDKTLRVLARRLAPAGASVTAQVRVPHRVEAVTEALGALAAGDVEMIVVFGASAVADRRDVVPAGLEAAGGRIESFGMPVDPGNLLLLGALGPERGSLPVVGAPGCARSPKENGFDWVLHRLLAGLPVRRADIVRLGVGGLLSEIPSRPQPRAGAPDDAP